MTWIVELEGLDLTLYKIVPMIEIQSHPENFMKFKPYQNDEFILRRFKIVNSIRFENNVFWIL